MIGFYRVVMCFKKKCEETHRVAQPPTLAAFLPWGSSEGADRMSLTPQKYDDFRYIKIYLPTLLKKYSKERFLERPH